jgi:hypothetical protein
MRIITRFGLLVLIILLAGVVLLPVHAQDAKIKCDADLILSLYTAENSLNYAAVGDKVMAAHPDMAMVDTSKLDYGQFTPLFDAMMKMMSENMMSQGSTMSDAMMGGMTDMMSMSMADMEKSMMASMPADANMPQMTTLAAGDIAGEPAECTALRASLRQFYTALAYEGLMMSMAEATPSP